MDSAVIKHRLFSMLTTCNDTGKLSDLFVGVLRGPQTVSGVWRPQDQGGLGPLRTWPLGYYIHLVDPFPLGGWPLKSDPGVTVTSKESDLAGSWDLKESDPAGLWDLKESDFAGSETLQNQILRCLISPESHPADYQTPGKFFLIGIPLRSQKRIRK